jgi:hypothetical protein
MVLAGLAIGGAVSHRLVAPAGRELRDHRAGLEPESLERALGQGLSVGVLGGFRGLIADFLWLRANGCWERRDPVGTMGTLRLVTAVDPRPLIFWLNGARMMAYDMPAWRVAAGGGYGAVPAGLVRRIDEEQARRALRWLDEARRHHPASPELFIEQANISLNRLHDPEAAAAGYRRAAELPGAPYYAARLHAILLCRLGRKAEALDWLVRLHPRLPADDEAAAADVVLGRIRDLEAELDVPVERRYRTDGS